MASQWFVVVLLACAGLSGAHSPQRHGDALLASLATASPAAAVVHVATSERGNGTPTVISLPRLAETNTTNVTAEAAEVVEEEEEMGGFYALSGFNSQLVAFFIAGVIAVTIGFDLGVEYLREEVFTTHIGGELLNNMMRELAILGFVSFISTTIIQFLTGIDELVEETFEFSHTLMFIVRGSPGRASTQTCALSPPPGVSFSLALALSLVRADCGLLCHRDQHHLVGIQVHREAHPDERRAR